MRKIKSVTAMAAIAFGLQGCAHLDRSSIAYFTIADGKTTEQRVFIWKGEYAAGIGTQNGICAQGPAVMKSTSISATAKVNDNALSAITGKLPAGKSEEAAKIASTFNQNAALTNATSIQTAYANISLFYLCQIALNKQSLSDGDIKEMWNKAHETATALSKDAVDVAKSLATPAVAPN